MGIPLFMVGSMGLLARLALADHGDVPALRPNAAWLVLLGTGVWYLWLDWKVGLPTWAAFVACYVIGCALPVALLWTFSGVAIVAHVVGHYGFEHKPPAVFSTPVALFEAPAWLLAIWTGLVR